MNTCGSSSPIVKDAHNSSRRWALEFSGRDSVIANNRTSSSINEGQDGIAKEDYPLILKLHKALKGTGLYDYANLRLVCQANDESGHGVIPRKKIRGLCVDQRVPLPGPLLNTLLKRCDDEKDGMVNWSECVGLLEKASRFDPKQYEKQNQETKKYQPLTSVAGKTEENLNGSRPKSQVAKGKPAGDKTKTGDNKDAGNKKTEDTKVKPGTKAQTNIKAKPTRPGTASSSRPKTASSRPGSAMDQSKTTKSSKSSDQDKGQKKDGDSKGQSSNKVDGGKKKSDVRASPELVDSNSESSKAGKSSNANKYAKSTMGMMGNITEASKSRSRGNATGLVVASDDTEEEYLKQAQEQINAPVKGQSKTSSHKNKPVGDGNKKLDAGLGRPSTAKVSASRPMTAKGFIPPRPATAKGDQGLGRAKSAASGRKVVLNRDMDVDFNKVECIGISKEKKESLISIYTGIPLPKGPIKKNSVSPEIKNTVVAKPSSKGGKGGKTFPSGDPLVSSLDSSQDSSVKSSTGSKSPDIKGVLLPMSSSNSLQSTGSSSQASNASDQPLLTSSPVSAPKQSHSSISDIALKESQGKSEGDGKLFKSFKGFLGMGKKKEEQDEDKKNLLDVESVSTTSQDGIELRSDAQLMNTEMTLEKDNNKDELPPEVEKPADDEIPPAPDTDKVDYTLHGKNVTYYRPDDYVGKTLCGDAPTASLKLDWVYGYRGNDCRCNMYVINSGELVYFMARIAVLYDIAKHGQRHYMEHTADIKSLAVHPNHVTIATGQSAGFDGSYVKACIRVWQSDSLETLHILGEEDLNKTVISINFAASGNSLVAVDGSDGHTMSIWDTESGNKLADKKIATEVICQVVFHPKRSQELISIGKEHMAYWKINQDTKDIQEIAKADYQTNMKAKYIICLAFRSNGDLVTGDSNGTVYIWPDGGNTISHSIRHAHEGPVFSLMYLKSNLITGGRDGLIQAWKFNNTSADLTGKIQIPANEGGVRMLQHHSNTMYIGTTLNGILIAQLNQQTVGAPLTGAILNDKPLTRGHYDNLHGAITHPSPSRTGHFITTGSDGTLVLSDANTHSSLWKHAIKGADIRCIDINLSGSLIALGTKDSHLILLGLSNDKDEITERCWIKMGKTPVITCVKFSPDGDMVAIGCSDSTISIMGISNEGKNSQPIGKCKGHTGAIVALDWSVEKKEGLGYLLQSSSTTIEHFYWNVTTCKQLEDTLDLRNMNWTSHYCPTGFYSAGTWGVTSDNPTIRCVDRSRQQTLMVAGDSTGDVLLYRYPCCKPQASSNTVTAHSSETSCVRFLADDKYVISTGGVDCTAMQWKIIM